MPLTHRLFVKLHSLYSSGFSREVSRPFFRKFRSSLHRDLSVPAVSLRIFSGTVAVLFYMLTAIHYFQFFANKKADLIIRSEVVRIPDTLKTIKPASSYE